MPDEAAEVARRAALIVAALKLKGWTRIRLAKATGYDERTVRNVIAGKTVRPQTIVDIGEALGVDLAPSTAAPAANVADADYGAYAESVTDLYTGVFSAFRRDFHGPGLVRTQFRITWSGEQRCLLFEEVQRYQRHGRQIDNSQAGRVHISPATDLVHLVTITRGAVRLITLTKPKLADRLMRGALLTQTERPLFFQPSVSAIFLRKETDPVSATTLGPLGAGDPTFAEAVAEIERIEREVVHFAPIARPALEV